MSSLALNLGLKKKFFGNSSNNDKILNLIQNLDKIFSNDSFNYQQIYTKCHEICQSRHGKDLYETLEIYLNYKVIEIQAKLILDKVTESKSNYLKKLVEFYKFHKEKIIIVSDIFLYLEKNKHKMGEGILSLKELFIKIFFNQIINHLNLKNFLFDCFYCELNDLRNNVSQEIEFFEEFIKILVNSFLIFRLKLKNISQSLKLKFSTKSLKKPQNSTLILEIYQIINYHVLNILLSHRLTLIKRKDCLLSLMNQTKIRLLRL